MQATYAKDKRNEGQYNVRVVGDGAADLEGQTVHVRTASGAEKPETLVRRIWSGDDNGQPVALYAKGGYSGRSQAPGGCRGVTAAPGRGAGAPGGGTDGDACAEDAGAGQGATGEHRSGAAGFHAEDGGGI